MTDTNENKGAESVRLLCGEKWKILSILLKCKNTPMNYAKNNNQKKQLLFENFEKRIK
jgi:hypothetical protein